MLDRRSAPALYFNPASRLSTAQRLVGALEHQLIDTDDEPYGFKNEHCRAVVRAVTRLCAIEGARDFKQRAEGIVREYLYRAQCIEGATAYDTTSRQKWDLLDALRDHEDLRAREWNGTTMRYLIDATTDETMIPVSSLEASARRTLGSQMHHGELDSMMTLIGWERITLQGHYAPGREGRRGGGHLRSDFYRGRPEDEDEPGEDA